ncbi:MAG: hypothetical protein MUC59_10550, partial [Saprospiraceae bacterium]|nr:hypothetical protein [Saprospiraceae bacterium]
VLSRPAGIQNKFPQSFLPSQTSSNHSTIFFYEKTKSLRINLFNSAGAAVFGYCASTKKNRQNNEDG